MKPSLLLLAAAGTLAACASSRPPAQPADTPVGMANPASVFCIEHGGRLESRRDAQGNEYALCHLPDGRVAEEWAFFRSQHQ